MLEQPLGYLVGSKGFLVLFVVRRFGITLFICTKKCADNKRQSLSFSVNNGLSYPILKAHLLVDRNPSSFLPYSQPFRTFVSYRSRTQS